MSTERPFSSEMSVVRHAMSGVFTTHAFWWEFGGSAVALALIMIAKDLSVRATSPIAFLLTGIGFIGAYVVLMMTGCMVARILASAAEGKAETGVGPVHFLVDNLTVGAFLPLVLSLGAVIVAALLCIPVALWRYEWGQAILAIPSVIGFAIIFAALAILFISLAVLPALVAFEQIDLNEAIRRLWWMMTNRKAVLVRYLLIGLVLALIWSVPVAIFPVAVSSIAFWLHGIAAGEIIQPFPMFVLDIYKGFLIFAPVAAMALAVVHSVIVSAYEEIAIEEDETAEEGISIDSSADTMKVHTADGSRTSGE